MASSISNPTPYIIAGLKPGYQLAYDSNSATFTPVSKGFFGGPVHLTGNQTVNWEEVGKAIQTHCDVNTRETTAQDRLDIRQALSAKAISLREGTKERLFYHPSPLRVERLNQLATAIEALADAVFPLTTHEISPDAYQDKYTEPLEDQRETDSFGLTRSPRPLSPLENTFSSPQTPIARAAGRRVLTDTDTPNRGPSLPLFASELILETSNLIQKNQHPSEDCRKVGTDYIQGLNTSTLRSQIESLEKSIGILTQALEQNPHDLERMAQKGEEVRCLKTLLENLKDQTKKTYHLNDAFGVAHKIAINPEDRIYLAEITRTRLASAETELATLKESSTRGTQSRNNVDSKREWKVLSDWKTALLQRQIILVSKDKSANANLGLSEEVKALMERAAFKAVDLAKDGIVALAAERGITYLLLLLQVA